MRAAIIPLIATGREPRLQAAEGLVSGDRVDTAQHSISSGGYLKMM
jgi:hypothetical protein